MTEPQTFQQAYCESRHLQPALFQQAFFKEVLYPLGKPLSLVILSLHPRFFSDEFDLISDIGISTEFEGFAARRNKLIDFTLYQIAPWRKVMGIRASGRKLFQIGNKVGADSFRDR